MIREAIAFVNDHELKQAELNSMAISRLGPWIAAPNIQKGRKLPTSKDFNPFTEIFYRREAKETIATSTARIVKALHDEGKIPSWVVANIDLELIAAAAE